MLGYWDFVDGISRGFAAHHAGMLPTFREIVEELFTAGRIRAVFATETLALGINMPARTVVLEKLVKFNGESHVDITPAEYTQLTGRAGRRGIDIEGHAVVIWNRGLDPAAVAGLASTRTVPAAVELPADLQHGRQPRRASSAASRPARSSRRPSPSSRPIGPSSGFVRTVRRNEEALAGLRRGDALPPRATSPSTPPCATRSADREGRRQARAASCARRPRSASRSCKIGDIIRIPTGRRSGLAVVVLPNRGGRGEAPSPAVVTEDHQLRRLTLRRRPDARRAARHDAVPKHFNAKSPKARRDLAATLRDAVPHDPPPRARPAATSNRRARAGSTSCAVGCGRTRATSAPTARTTRAGPSGGGGCARDRRAAAQDRRAAPTPSRGRSTGSASCSSRWATSVPAAGRVTERGERLRRLYTEKDLLAAECLREGVWGRLDAPVAGRRRLDAHPRAAARGGRAQPADAERRRARGVDRMVRLWSASRTARRARAADDGRPGRRASPGWSTAGPSGHAARGGAARHRPRRR